MRKINLAIKRMFDIIFSGIGLLILLPLLVLTALVITITMPGPIFFKQQRAGKNGKLFNILKFRSMKVDKSAEFSHDTSKDLQRLTPFGKLIRRLKIDELPQLINVLIGDMSLVGPRPTFKEQTEHYSIRQMKRLDMRPGMTGLAQVNGNIALTWDERIEYDLEYVENFTILLDVKILFKTVLVVVFGEDKFRNPKNDYSNVGK